MQVSFPVAMSRILPISLCFGLVAPFLVHGAFGVHARVFQGTENHEFRPDVHDVQNKIIALLLQKGHVPIGEDKAVGVEISRRVAELEQLEALKEEIELETDLASHVIEAELPRPRKKSCFWKYCV